jgi:glycosyltransferase involved in cell wall biosynthesis
MEFFSVFTWYSYSMTTLLVLLFISGLLELLAVYLNPSKSQKVVVFLISELTLAISFGLVIINFSAWTIFILFFSFFRAINMLRLIDARKQLDYLRTTFISSSRNLLSLQLIVLLIAYLSRLAGFSYQAKWVAIVAVQFIGAIVVGLSLRRNLIKTRPLGDAEYMTDHDLPSITVAIPARNETDDLDACLNSLVKSNYPKIEILVLDDCSQDKHTPEIIKQFAHDGVRFLAGRVPPESWSAKNYAYQQLSEAASGKIILFCGVDVRFEPDTIRQMVELMLLKRKTMLSFIPNNPRAKGNLFSQLAIQPCRYFWELGLPRRSLNRPAVLSTCWLINKTDLLSDGGFKAVSRNVLPERYFARETIKRSDGYSFVQSSSKLGLSCQKSLSEQYDTAIRTKYPILKQRLELASIVSLSEALLLVLPIVVFVIELIAGNWLIMIISGLNFVIFGYCFYRVVNLTYQKSLPLSLFVLPLIGLYDIYLLLNSMWQYEFNEVVWKGRNVCIPVMRVIPNLPKY